MNTRQRQKRHATHRANQRYGLKYNRFVRRDIVLQIQLGKAKFLSRTSNRVTVWSVNYEQQELIVVYDKLRKNIVTFLPIEAKLRYISN